MLAGRNRAALASAGRFTADRYRAGRHGAAAGRQRHVLIGSPAAAIPGGASWFLGVPVRLARTRNNQMDEDSSPGTAEERLTNPGDTENGWLLARAKSSVGLLGAALLETYRESNRSESCRRC